jgi:hypothetical protein
MSCGLKLPKSSTERSSSPMTVQPSIFNRLAPKASEKTDQQIP